jgi:hypothetical protein
MIVIKVWCLPQPSQSRLRKVYESLVRAVKAVPELGKDPDMLVLMPSDLMKYGLGEEILIEVTGLPASRKINREVRNRLANHVGRALYEFYPLVQIEARVFATHQDEGHWHYR